MKQNRVGFCPTLLFPESEGEHFPGEGMQTMDPEVSPFPCLSWKTQGCLPGPGFPLRQGNEEEQKIKINSRNN